MSIHLASASVLSASRPNRAGFMRYYFVVLACFYLVVAAVGFTPSYQAHFAGEYYIFPIAHLHGALMGIFLLLFLFQTYFIASDNLRLHRKAGIISCFVAAAAWISMLIATRRPLVAEVLPEDHFLYDVLLIQIMLMLLFPVLLTWGIVARNRPNTHKRVMVFLMVVILQVAIDRMRWLPSFGLPKHFGSDIYVYVLLLPLLLFDLVTLRRIHRTTLTCLLILICAHFAVSLPFETLGWHRFAAHLTDLMR